MPPRPFDCARTSTKSLASITCRYLSQLQTSRPPNAAPQFPNYKHIRQNVELYAENCANRNYQHAVSYPAEIARLKEESHGLSDGIARLARTADDLGRKIAQSKTANNRPSVERQSSDAALDNASDISFTLKALRYRQSSLEDTAQIRALSLPNLTSSQTPKRGEGPRVISYFNYNPDQPPSNQISRSHVDIGTSFSLLDFQSAGVISGWGFYFLLNEAVLLEQALVQYATSVALRRGWRAVTPPSLVYSYLASACGFQPRDQNDEQQIWHLDQTDDGANKPSRSLAATAEIPLAAMHAGKTIKEEELPLKYVGSNRCYRAEAGARGVDTKGLYRVHEFTKVEMFAWTNTSHDESSNSSSSSNSSGKTLDTYKATDEFSSSSSSQLIMDEMLSIQKEILCSLNLPGRILEMPSDDLGAAAYRKIDIEVLFPSRSSRHGGWGEVTSLSSCTDYQSRRLGTKILDKSGKMNRFPLTLNGTAMAVPRVLAAILEHGWVQGEEEGGGGKDGDGADGGGYVVIPEVLRPYMAGQAVIRRRK